MATYILADNRELTRYAFHSLLEREPGNQIIVAGNKTALIEALKSCETAIVVLDYTLFDFNDVESMLNVRDRYPQSWWLLLSEELTASFVRKVVYTNPSVSILFKDASILNVRDALDQALRRERYLSPRVTEMLLSRVQEAETNTGGLSPTEIEILTAITKGKTTKKIAEERFSSVHTINTHRWNIFRKLNVNTAHEAIKYALRAGLVNPAEYYI